MWKKVDLTRDEDRAAQIALGGKARLLVDEDISDWAEALVQVGFNALSVYDVGLDGHSDEDVFAFGWRKNRMIITSDKDYLDDQRFPFHRCPGVVVVPSPAAGESGVINALSEVVPVLKKYAHALNREKTVISPDGTWLIKGFSKERGVHFTSRLKTDPHGNLLEWDDGD